MAAPFLTKRRAGWYLRMRVPAGLCPLLGTHLTRSLKTRDYTTARRRAICAAAELQSCWNEAWRVMAAVSGTPSELLTAEDFIAADRIRTVTQIAALTRSVRARLAASVDAAVHGDTSDAVGTVADTANRAGELSEAHLRGQLEGMREALALIGRAPVAQASADVPMPEPRGLREESASPWPQLVERFFAARPSVGESARTSHRQAFRELEELIGAKPVNAVTKADVARYVEWLEDKPNGRAGRQRLSRDSIVKQLQHVRSFFAWAEEKAYTAVNPALGVRPRTRTREERDEGEGRRAFTVPELKHLFDSPLFTGCAGPRNRSKRGKRVLRDERYWFFLVALCTGARIEELAEAPSALVAVGEVTCLDLREAGTKTGNSPRLVPILPALERLGFVAWAKGKVTAGAPKLFQGGMASADWSKWTNRYLDLIGLDASDVCTYSLRHGFRQMLRAAALGDELMDKVFGHATGKTGARYGRALSPDEAHRIVSQVKPPLFLAHLLG